MGTILSVNLADPQPSKTKGLETTGILKRPTELAVAVRAPGPKTVGLHSGLVGDQIFDVAHHGGDEQAVYAYAREDYDWWAEQLGRPLAGGYFGENLTTVDIDVNGATIGQVWAIGAHLRLQITSPRIPCATFQAHMGEKQWVRRFTAAGRPGAYLRVDQPGEVSAGDECRVIHDPGHGVTIADYFRAYTTDSALLARLVEVEGLAEQARLGMRNRLSR